VYGEFLGHCLSCSRGRIEYSLTLRSDWNGWEKLVAARGWDLPGVRQTTVCRLKHTAAQMWTHPPGVSRYVALTSSEECVNPLLIYSCCYHPPGRGRIQQLSVAINQSIRLFQVNKPIATVIVGDRQKDRHKQYMQYISKRKTQKHT